MRVYPVVRNLTTKTGAVLQTTVRTYETEQKAREACALRQGEFDCMLDALLVHKQADGGGRVAGRVMEFLSDLGLRSVSYQVAWADVSDTDVAVAEKRIVVPA